ncbi:MAG: glycogen synthase [Spirochaetia bacterium]|nr:glycogen synthase [Spirochaetia bacterium]
MRILMISSEAVPFSKSGGLADVASSLSIALSELNNDVRLIIPNYGITDSSSFTRLGTSLEIPLAGKIEQVDILFKKMKEVSVYLIDHPFFSERKGIYGNTSFTPYPDNLLRYTLMSKVALALPMVINWIPQILHCHDWTTGFIPYMAKQDKQYIHTTTVFTIHNLAYQGEYPRLDMLLSDMKIDSSMLFNNSIDSRVNMLKTGLVHADIITTVSPTYAKEIQGEEQGCHLDLLLKNKSNRLFGILNGIDLDEWNPETDGLLDYHFSPLHMENKAVLKEQIQKRFNLPIKADVPIISMISRIAEQKGFYELTQGSPSPLEQMITELNVQVIIIGTGDRDLEDKLIALSQLHENLSVNLIFSNEAAHLVEAGSDFFLMPSRYEPCGLNQMYSMRYGTIVIARKTGGLADSIIDVQESNGTGFLFNEISGSAMFESVQRAVSLYYEDRQELEAIRKRGMEVDFSWTNSALEYMKVYNTIIKG